jgi:hypothetical protein
MYRYCPLVSAADGIIAPFTSQTSPVSPTVGLYFLKRLFRLHIVCLVFASCDFEAV